jgi:hypothetical protein
VTSRNYVRKFASKQIRLPSGAVIVFASLALYGATCMHTQHFEITEVHGVTATRFLLPPDWTVFRAAAAEIRAHFSSAIKLWDCSCGLALSAEELRAMADKAKRLDAETLKLAIVAPEDEVYGLARLFSVHRAQEHLQLQVFRDRDAAFQWLDSIAGSA